MNPGIVICSRSNSSRIPHKPFQRVKNKYLIHHLLDQLLPIKIPICVAVPESDASLYKSILDQYKNVTLSVGNADSPLHRTEIAAIENRFDTIIRVTHDKVFVDRQSLRDALKYYNQNKIDYLYGSNLVEGSGFEIFSAELLDLACKHFNNRHVEHISYALKSVPHISRNFYPTGHYNKNFPDIRFLIDFEEDLEFIRSVFGYSLSGNPDLKEALETVDRYPFLKKINKQPEVTLYTCVYNEEDFIQWCIESVISQTIFPNLELIIIDDASTDGTYKKILSSKHFAKKHIKLRRNEKNIGLSSSSNVALNMARGKYIMRLDADDALLFPFTLEKMLKKAKQEDFEALYPSYIDHQTKTLRSGKDTHHVGGCLFLTKAIRNIQFTEKLRGFEGRDLFERAKDQIKIGYYDEMPAFFYRDKLNSMSKSNLEYRERIKKGLESGLTGIDLVGAPI